MMRRKPPQCPHCGSAKVIEIVYDPAKPDPTLESEKIILRRTKSSGSDAHWHCARCHLEWGHPHGISGSRPGDDGLA